MLVLSDILRGYTDTIILAVLYNKDSYGYEISKFVLEKTKNNFELKEATLYTAFKRLENNGVITSYWGDEFSGARRKYYTITSKGKELFLENFNDYKKSKIILDELINIK